MEFNNGSLTVTMPDLSALSIWEWVFIGVGISVIYGFITHFHSLPAIHRWNTNVIKKWRVLKASGANKWERGIGQGGFVALLLYRLFVNLTGRIVSLVLGTFLVGCVFVSSGKIRSNPVFWWGWHWHVTAQRAAAIIND